MRTILLLVLTLPIWSFAQNRPKLTHELGVELLPILAYGSGQEDITFSAELIYKIRNEQEDWRFKLQVNDQQRYFKGVSSIYGFHFANTCTQQRKLLNIPDQRTNYILNIGYTRQKSIKNIPFYVGVDFRAGLNRSLTWISFESCELVGNPASENTQIIADGQLANYVITVGLTPILGTRLMLTSNIGLSLELGIPLSYDFGLYRFFDELGDINAINVSNAYIENAIIQDIAIFIRF